MLDDTQIERYSRQILLPEVGGRGQERLLQSRVVLVGAGRLGHLVASYLTGAGVGRLVWSPGVEDPLDTPQALIDDLAAANPDVVCAWLAHPGSLAEAPVDIVAVSSADRRDWDDANSIAINAGIPLVAGCASAASAWVGVFAGHLDDASCLRCADLPHEADQAGGLGRALGAATTTTIASLQATAVLSVLLGIGQTPRGMLWCYAADSAVVAARSVARRTGCAGCRP